MIRTLPPYKPYRHTYKRLYYNQDADLAIYMNIHFWWNFDVVLLFLELLSLSFLLLLIILFIFSACQEAPYTLWNEAPL